MRCLKNYQEKLDTKELLSDYWLDFGVFTNIDDRLYTLKDKLLKLDEPKKIVLLLYAELGSYKKVGDLLGFSHSTTMHYIKAIREELLC